MTDGGGQKTSQGGSPRTDRSCNDSRDDGLACGKRAVEGDGEKRSDHGTADRDLVQCAHDIRDVQLPHAAVLQESNSQRYDQSGECDRQDATDTESLHRQNRAQRTIRSE